MIPKFTQFFLLRRAALEDFLAQFPLLAPRGTVGDRDEGGAGVLGERNVQRWHRLFMKRNLLEPTFTEENELEKKESENGAPVP